MAEETKVVQEKAKPVRKVAPPIIIGEVHRDDRAAIIAELNQKNPEFVHSYQSGHTSADQLLRKGMEVVKGEDGKVLMHESDIVVKTSREVYDKKRAKESDDSHRISSKIAGPSSDIRQKREPKKIRVRQEEDNING